MAASQNIYFYLFAIFFIIGLIDCELRPLKEHDRREQDFDVKPGGDVQIVEETWSGVTCKFKYAAQGGTNEQWKLTMIRDSTASIYRCTVERPGHKSYLFFTEFEMNISGITMSSYNIHSAPQQNMAPNEYTVDFTGQTIRHVPGLFNSELDKVELQARTERAEL